MMEALVQMGVGAGVALLIACSTIGVLCILGVL